MYTLKYRSKAVAQLEKLSLERQRRIIDKLEFYIASEAPLVFAKRLTNSTLGQYRFRVGDYRIIFDIEVDVIVILEIGNRKDIYKK